MPQFFELNEGVKLVPEKYFGVTGVIDSSAFVSLGATSQDIKYIFSYSCAHVRRRICGQWHQTHLFVQNRIFS
ncbi:hypothetical protein SLA2020_061120 [Shorea laevis]